MKQFMMILTLMVAAALVPAMAEAEHKNEGRIVYVDVNGLVCDFCARALEKVFGRQEEVSSIDVNLDTKVITVAFHEGESLSADTITSLVTDAGYAVVAVRQDGEGDGYATE